MPPNLVGHPVNTNPKPGGTESASSARQQFANTILGVAPTHPEADVQAICKAWQTVTGAATVWFLLKNPYTSLEPWELFAVLPNSGAPQRLTFPIDNLAEYSVQTRECLFIDDIPNWSAVWTEKKYTIPWASELAAIGVKNLECIPLLKPIMSEESGVHVCPIAEGAVVLGYTGEEERIPHAEPS